MIGYTLIKIQVLTVSKTCTKELQKGLKNRKKAYFVVSVLINKS